jgi:TolB-like protein/tetratricopeptide (TPR) repeat protein
LLSIRTKELLKEARRRRVFRASGLYIVGAWVVVQIALAAFPALSISESAVRYVWIAALLGFPVAIVFGWRYDIRGGRIVKTGAAGSSAPLTLQRADYVVLVAIGFVAVAILAGSLREITKMEPGDVWRPSPGDIDAASVAVLPFVNMSSDAQNEYFSDGLTETLLHMLAQLPDLKVSARTSAFSFKNKNVDIRSIALSLGVAHVLEGSVQKAGDRVRVTAQLIRAGDGFHVWSQNYDRTLDDIFVIQDEIAADVAAALGSSLLAENNAGMLSIQTDNVSAYDLYLQALEQQNINTNEALLKADQLFGAALDKDPGFDDAKLGLARNHLWKYWKFAVRYSDPEEYRAARALIREVLDRRPENLSAQVMDLALQLFIGYIENTHWGRDETLEPLVDEMLLLANQGAVDSFLTRLLVGIISGRDRDEEAMALLLSALETDPLNIDLLWAQAQLYRRTGRPEEARQPLLTALKIAPDNPQLYMTLGVLAESQGEFVESMNWFRQAHIADPESAEFAAVIARSFYHFGLLQEGDPWLERARLIDPDYDLVGNEIYRAAEARDQDRLLELVERALPLVLTAEVDYFLPTVYYPAILSSQGRSQEALDHLTGLIPAMQDYSKLVDGNRFAQYMQIVSFNLQSDVMDRDSFERLAQSMVKAIEAQYPDVYGTPASVNTINKMLLNSWVGNHEKARELFLEGHADWPMFNGQWLQLQIYPWFERLRNDPEVAAAIDEYEQKKARIADELRAMSRRPEWQLSQ